MADETGDIKENRNIRNRNNSEEERQEAHEYLPNIVRLEPDIGLGNRVQQEDRKRRNEGNPSRREEGSISFRHFLQNDAGPSSSAAYPDLYNCSRQESTHFDGADLDPESPDLPDFVQDHLAVEHMYFNDGTVSSSSAKNLPDFASCVVRNDSAVQRHPADNQRRELHVIAPLPFDLTTEANVVNNSGESNSPVEPELGTPGVRLPDFLSDGHVLGHSNNRHRNIRTSSENGNTLDTYTERHNIIVMLRQENNRLRDELSVLQSVLMKKDDRIKELEDLVMALEISKLQMSTDANTQTMDKVTTDGEIARLRKELETSKNDVQKLQKEKINSFAKQCQPNLPETSKRSNANLVQRVKEMTNTSESLVRELLKIITDMQADLKERDSQDSHGESARSPDE